MRFFIISGDKDKEAFWKTMFFTVLTFGIIGIGVITIW